MCFLKGSYWGEYGLREAITMKVDFKRSYRMGFALNVFLKGSDVFFHGVTTAVTTNMNNHLFCHTVD